MNKHAFSSAPSHRSCRGFSLFEVLITVVVVSIGLLGLAGLQFAGLRASNQAQEHTIATHLAQDAIERIRANQAAGVGAYNGPITAAGTASQDCSAGCIPAQMVQYDLYQLSQMIAAAGSPVLPNASITIATNPNTVTITWGDPVQALVLNY